MATAPAMSFAWPANVKIDRSLLGGLPAVVAPLEEGGPLVGAGEGLPSAVAREIALAGGVLLRGFRVEGTDAFRNFAASFGHPLLSYDFASTPRSALAPGV